MKISTALIAIFSLLTVILVVTIIAMPNILNIFKNQSDRPQLETVTPKKIISQPFQETIKEKLKTPKPSFDIVRVDAAGDTLIAGRASPGAHILIMDGETIIGEVKADNRGEWVFIPDIPLKPGTRHLRLGEVTNYKSVKGNENESNAKKIQI